MTPKNDQQQKKYQYFKCTSEIWPSKCEHESSFVQNLPTWAQESDPLNFFVFLDFYWDNFNRSGNCNSWLNLV